MYTKGSEWAYVMNYNHYREIEDEKPKRPLADSNPQPCALQFDASSGSSGLVLPASGALVQWLSGRTCAWAPSGRSFHAWSDPDLTQFFVSIQTAASHGLDHSTALPVPASKTNLCLAVTELKF